jgi:hypothetical protein
MSVAERNRERVHEACERWLRPIHTESVHTDTENVHTEADVHKDVHTKKERDAAYWRERKAEQRAKAKTRGE